MNKILQQLIDFRKERDWEKYHSGLTLSHKLCIESAELAELFEWGKKPDKQRLSEELADVRIILEYLAHDNGINLDEAVTMKIKMNEEKYPIKDYPEWNEAVK